MNHFTLVRNYKNFIFSVWLKIFFLEPDSCPTGFKRFPAQGVDFQCYALDPIILSGVESACNTIMEGAKLACPFADIDSTFFHSFVIDDLGSGKSAKRKT